MNKLHNASKVLVIVAASLVSLLTGPIFDLLRPGLGKGGASAAVLVLLVITLVAVQTAFDNLVEHVSFVRRLLLGKSFVEGYWVDVSKNPENEIVGLACLFIDFQEGELAISGTTARGIDSVNGSWDTTFAVLVGGTLAYSFLAHTSASASAVETGYGELSFVHGYGLPTNYSGYFFDTAHKKLITLCGSRITDPRIIEKLENPKMRIEYLQSRYLAEVKQNEPSRIKSAGAPVPLRSE
jgi:hypothetical protein